MKPDLEIGKGLRQKGPVKLKAKQSRKKEVRTMKKTLLVVLAVVALVASLGFATVASASATESPAKAAIRGVGSLSAQGDGIAILAGRGTVDITGNGVLWVKDKSGNATIEVTGYGEKEEFNDGWVQYSGFHGTAHIEGRRIGVVLAGVDIDLSAEGRGLAVLWGHGTCEKNGETYEWSAGPGPLARFFKAHSY